MNPHMSKAELSKARQLQFQADMEEAVESFIVNALYFKIGELFPALTDDQRHAVVGLVWMELLRSKGKGEDYVREFLNTRYQISTDADFAKVKAIGEDIMNAVMGLGGDVEEPGAIHRIHWTQANTVMRRAKKG